MQLIKLYPVFEYIYLLDILDFPERLLYSPNCHPAESAIFYQAYCTLKLEEHMKEKDCHHTLTELLNEHDY